MGASLSSYQLPSMTSRQKVRLGLFAFLGLFMFLVLGTAFGFWESEIGAVSPRGYVAISHGDHTHYVPNGWTGEVSISNFPTNPPPPGQTVGPTGQFVPVN